MPKFDQMYLDHLEETLRAASAIVDRVMPINVGSRDEHTQRDRSAQRQTALDNLLMDMLDQPYVATSTPADMGWEVSAVDPKSPEGQAILDKYAPPGTAQDVPFDDPGPR